MAELYFFTFCSRTLLEMNKTFTSKNKCALKPNFCTLPPYFLHHKLLNEAHSKATNGSRLSR